MVIPISSPVVRVYLGSDHAGFELKAHLVQHLTDAGHEVVDVGAAVYDTQDDYPPFCVEAARRAVADEGSLGVVIGGSGHGGPNAGHKGAGRPGAPPPRPPARR